MKLEHEKTLAIICLVLTGVSAAVLLGIGGIKTYEEFKKSFETIRLLLGDTRSPYHSVQASWSKLERSHVEEILVRPAVAWDTLRRENAQQNEGRRI